MIRTFLILAALVVSGIGFARLTQKGAEMPIANPIVVTDPAEIRAKVHLVFSVAPTVVVLESSGKPVGFSAESSTSFSGQALISEASPVLILTATRTKPTEGEVPPFFAKLIVEAEGKETFTHVFDADGDIDDFVELPF